ncbi:hypothetical protein V1506DRAFT_556409 [Lipomyces tetrasporus]
MPDESALSDKDMTLSLLKNNPPEQRLDIPLSFSQYLELEEDWSNIKTETGISEDQRYPYLSYNSLIHIATVVTVPRDLHEITREIMNSIEAYLSIHKPDAVGTIVDSGSARRIYLMSDGVFKYNRGSSETYAALCRDKDMWLDGRHVNVCILSIEKMNLVANKNMPSRYGPISYRNHHWLGTLKEGFIEVWRENSSVRYALMETGKIHDTLPTNIGPRLREFYPKEAWKAADIPDGDIPINGTIFMIHIKTAIIATAVGRFSDFVSQ